MTELTRETTVLELPEVSTLLASVASLGGLRIRAYILVEEGPQN